MNDDSCESAQEHSSVDADAERRIKRSPRWMDDYESGEGFSEDEDITYLALFAGDDPIHYIEVAKSSNGRKAMDAEIEAIEGNETWELTELPVG